MIQFPGHLLNCLEIDIPYIQKVPKQSTWIIQGLAPSSTPPHKLIALASHKYRDSTTQDTTLQSKEFDIESLRRTLAQPPTTPTQWASIKIPDTEDFAPDILCLAGFTPTTPRTEAPTQQDIAALTSSLYQSLSTTKDQATTPITQTRKTPNTTTAQDTPIGTGHGQNQQQRTQPTWPIPPPSTTL